MRWVSEDDEPDASASLPLLRRNGTTTGTDSLPDVSLPLNGRLLWLTPDGDVREVEPSGVDATGNRACPRCESRVSVATRAREHPPCGHVGLDGFAIPETGVECPKCGDRDGPFPIVGRVHSCVTCGRVFDRPLGIRL